MKCLGRDAHRKVFPLARVRERATLLSMRRAPRSVRPWGLLRASLAAALALPGCHTTLEPVRLGLTPCSEIGISGVEYALCEAPLDHAAAELDCEQRAAHLAALETREESEAVAGAVFAVVTSGNVWLGGSRNDDLVWSWVNGDVFWRGGLEGKAEADAFVSWQPGEPNNTSSQGGGPEACLALTGEGADWNDRRCDLALPYVCEVD